MGSNLQERGLSGDERNMEEGFGGIKYGVDWVTRKERGGLLLPILQRRWRRREEGRTIITLSLWSDAAWK